MEGDNDALRRAVAKTERDYAEVEALLDARNEELRGAWRVVARMEARALRAEARGLRSARP